MKPQAPAITPVRELTLREINDQLSKIRQRLDSGDLRSVEAPATVAQTEVIAQQMIVVTKQIAALAKAGKEMIDDIRSAALPTLNICDGTITADGSIDARGIRFT